MRAWLLSTRKRVFVVRFSCLATSRRCFHPAQVDVIHELFSPSAEEVAHARRVLSVFAEAERAGRGSTSLDGQVIDVAVLKRARQVLALAGRA